MMKKLIALVFAVLLASPVLAQEAPDVLVRRVTEEVLEIVRKDRDIQNGSTQKAVELVDQKVLPHFDFRHMTALAVG
jgi:phospholipid transport system substrate-binding protein